MDATLGLVLAPPAPGASVFACGYRRRAWHAADRWIAARHEGMGGKVVGLRVGGDLLRRPGRERIDLDVRRVSLEGRDRSARRGLVALASGDPGTEGLQRLGQRLDLAEAAALVGVDGEQGAARIVPLLVGHRRADGPYVSEAEPGDQGVAVCQGLRKQPPRI